MHLLIRTDYDCKEYKFVEGIYCIDSDGFDQEHKAAAVACIDVSTGADQGVDTWRWIQEQAGLKLEAAGITYLSLDFHSDESTL